MMAIFHDMIEETMKVFMEDFFGSSGDSFCSSCLSHLDKMLKRCKDTNLVLNWEKYHFMVKEGIVLGHKISKFGIEVNKAKVDVIAKLPHPTSVKGVHSFLGHVRFYRRFIQDFSKIARPMTHLLEKDTPFIFSKECIEAFNILKKKLTVAPILVAPDWDLPFEIMCDASDYAVGAVLGQQFDVIIRDKKGAENLAADHLSRLENPHQDDVFTAKKPLISSRFATMDLPGDIMVPTTSLRKSLILVFIGLLFTEMPMTWSYGVTLVKVKAKSRNMMKCLKIQFKFARSLTYGASISWGHSRLLEGISTFSWPLTTYLNGFKQKSSPLMMPELS
ncbi:reverse transcriptase domain-containing protein [Tanacetum coccineum]